MTALHKAAQQALEALDTLYRTLTPETPLAKSLKQRADTLRAALEEPVQEPCFRPMDFEGGRQGWYISHPDFYVELEPDAAGQWSAFFRTKDGKEAFAEQEPVAVVALDTSQPFVAMCYDGQVTKWEQVSEHKTVMMFKDLPLNTPLYASPTQRKPLTDKEKITLVRNWFAENWAIKNAIGLLEDYERAIEQAHGIKE